VKINSARSNEAQCLHENVTQSISAQRTEFIFQLEQQTGKCRTLIHHRASGLFVLMLFFF